MGGNLTDMTPEEVTALAVERYGQAGYDTPADCVFALLVDVAGTYAIQAECSADDVACALAENMEPEA
jgi:hypothetical protein